MPYSFVWLYLIKCVFTCSIFLDSNIKRFLSVFGKYFVFTKTEKFQKQCCPTFWPLTSVAKIARFAKRSFFFFFFNIVLKKGLNFFFLHPVNVHFLVSLSIFQHHWGQLQNLQLFCHHFLNLQGKVWVLSSTLYFSQLLPFPHGFCAFYDICISLDRIWVFDCLVSSLCVFRWLYIDLLYIVTTLGR